MNYSATLQAETSKVPANVISGKAMRLGMDHSEPLTVAFDGMLRYARAYGKRFEQPLSNDSFLGPQYLTVIQGLRGLLNGDGAVAYELGLSCDSKDNSVLESMFWHCMEAGGFREADL